MIFVVQPEWVTLIQPWTDSWWLSVISFYCQDLTRWHQWSEVAQGCVSSYTTYWYH